MKRTLSLAAVTFGLFLITPTMHAQATHLKLQFHVPFSFDIDNQTFAPGDYEFTRQSLFVLKVCNLKDHTSAFQPIQPAQSRKEGNSQIRLVFHRYDNQYFLTAVSDGSWESTYDFKISAEEQRLVQAAPREPEMTVSINRGGAVLVAARGQK
jgi:hypothetical protein